MIACSPGGGVPQSSVQNRQANSRPCEPMRWDHWRSSFASCHGPASTCTSTFSIAAPQAAPITVYLLPRRVTLAGADLSRSWVTDENVQMV